MLVLVVERMRALLWVHAISDAALKQMLVRPELAHVRPESALALALVADDPREALADVREIASTRLRLLRVCATLASTLGLLGGILLLAGAPLPGQGLLALAAGAVARARMNGAIETMAIGVATSALCFQALAILRRAATKQLHQADQIARARGL
ncbi:MAG TPA: hypothetical protein VI299_08065 [Polyangiales bacterium]